MSGTESRETEIIAQVRELLEPVIESEGMELVEVEYRREAHGWVLRLFIDHEGAVLVDDCAHISQVVGDLLDVADVIRNPYHLEVSSPGLDRPLRKPEHFQRYTGKIVDVRTIKPLYTNRRRFKGVLVASDSEQITMNCDGQLYTIPLDLVDRARLCYFESFEGKSS